MRNRLRTLGLAALVGMLCFSAASAEIPVEGIGEVGGGIFLPTGSDGDAAKTSPALQLVASLGFRKHLGAEAEFLYVPILLKSSVLESAAYRRSSQISAVGGLRVMSGQLVEGAQPAVGYFSLRVGFARITSRAAAGFDSLADSWIQRSVDELESAGFFSSSATQRGFVLSPKAGVLFRVSDRAALDLAFYPIFIFDREKVSKQLFFTLSFALSAWQSF